MVELAEVSDAESLVRVTECAETGKSPHAMLEDKCARMKISMNN
jgi:hypothetical protein